LEGLSKIRLTPVQQRVFLEILC